MQDMNEVAYHQRIRTAREKRGVDEHTMAKLIGVNSQEYYDLESYPEELMTVLNISTVKKLCEELHIAPLFLLTADGENVQSEQMSFEELMAQIPKYLDQNKMTLEALEGIVGWSFIEALKDPSACLSWNLVCLRDLTLILGIDWLRVPASNFQVTCV